MKIKFQTVILIAICIHFSYASAQNDQLDYFTADISIIQSYGLEDKPTLKLIKTLSDDTNHLILVDDGYFYMRDLLAGKETFYFGEEKLCEEYISILFGRNNVIGCKSSAEPYLPVDFLSRLNPEAYTILKDKILIPKGVKSDSLWDIKHLDSLSRLELLHVIFHFFELNPMDSVNMEHAIFAQKINISSYMNNFKQCFFFRYDHGIKNGAHDFVSNYKSSKHPVYIMIASKGTAPKSIYNFRNKIRNARKLQPYSILEIKALPRIVATSKYEKFNRAELINFKFIYVPELDNCTW